MAEARKGRPKYNRINQAGVNVIRNTNENWVGVHTGIGDKGEITVFTRKEYDRYNNLKTVNARKKFAQKVASGQSVG